MNMLFVFYYQRVIEFFSEIVSRSPSLLSLFHSPSLRAFRQHASIRTTIGGALGAVRVVTFPATTTLRIIGVFRKVPRRDLLDEVARLKRQNKANRQARKAMLRARLARAFGIARR